MEDIMKHTTVLITPLLLAVTLTMLATPFATATPVGGQIYGEGYARVCCDWREFLGMWECGDIYFGYLLFY